MDKVNENVDQFNIVNIEQLEKSDLQLLVSPRRMRDILKEIGYDIKDNGDLVDISSEKNALTENGEVVNLNKMKNLALIGGSHIFVKNLASYSQVLAQKKEINFTNVELKK